MFLDMLTPLNGEKAAATAVQPVEGSESSTLEECLPEHAGGHEYHRVARMDRIVERDLPRIGTLRCQLSRLKIKDGVMESWPRWLLLDAQETQETHLRTNKHRGG